MGTVITIVGGFVAALGGLILLEVGPTCSWIAPKVVRWAARRLPVKYRETREDEWLAELASMDAGMKVTKLIYALGTPVAVFRMLRMPSVRAAREQERVERSETSTQYTINFGDAGSGAAQSLVTDAEGGARWSASAAAFTAWRSGEREGLDELVRLLSPTLWHVVRATGIDRESAEDVLQGTWLALVDRADTIANPAAVAGWLCTTARRDAWKVSKNLGSTT